MRFLTAEERHLLREMALPHSHQCATEEIAATLRSLETVGNVARAEETDDLIVWDITERGRLALFAFDAVHGAGLVLA